MEAGQNVLLEKPMVMNAGEAQSLIAARDRTGRQLLVAFPGRLSPQVRPPRPCCVRWLGRNWNVSAAVWQNWSTDSWHLAAGSGRFRRRLLFDTGAHMLNTIADLAGEDFVSVAAWLDDNDRPVDRRAVMGRLASGALVTMNGGGEAIHPPLRM